MIIVFHKNFNKQLKKLSQKEKTKVAERLKLFMVHPLVGRYQGYRSIDIAPDLRALYIKTSDDTATFVELGSHSQLY
ncbi:MAG: type II toxin-antitoxin system mRNA interferase toxin, RelE/StbE family [Candidatus Kerfeldbacteria bacterium]|nr:type II toxin-antitoxin system mRNA interferase toxin, RelE/StbE family [Candidatus Kerfeldbacteria bacterium]